MVLTFKRDPSNDVCYSSLKVDEKAWRQKGFYTPRTDRFVRPANGCANYGAPAQYGADKFYDAKPDLGTRVVASPVRYAVLGATSPRGVDAGALAGVDTRFTQSRQPYAKPLGPGTYNADRPHRVPVGHYNDPARSSSAFRSLPRPAEKVKVLPDPSDTLQRDHRQWHSARGFSSPRAKRFQGGNLATAGYGGLYALAQKYNIAAFDSFYDTDTGRYSTIHRQVCESPVSYSASFKSVKPRFPPLVDECGQEIGPGKYLNQDVPSVTVRSSGNSSLFMGPPRFSPS